MRFLSPRGICPHPPAPPTRWEGQGDGGKSLLTTLLLLPGAVAWAQSGAPGDIVGRGDIAYDQLGSLAAQGRLPGYTLRDFARGDRLYTRAEIAAILAQTPLGSGSSAASVRALFIRFAPELHALSPNSFSLDPRIPASKTEVGGWLRARLLTEPDAGGLVGRLHATVPFGRDGFLTVSGGDWRREWYDPSVVRSHGGFPPIETAFVHVDGRGLNVSLGYQPVRQGAGYSGALTLNDSAPTIPQLGFDKSFLLPGHFGRHLGRIAFSTFIGQFWESDDPTAVPDARGGQRYLANRRLVFHGGKWDFTVSESLKASRLPDPQWALFHPTLWLYQNDWTRGTKRHYLGFLPTQLESDTYWKNYQFDSQVAYHADRHNGTMLYADLLVDDIKTLNGLGDGFNTPQKLGEQIGVYLPHIGGETGRVGARLEYTSIDPGTFTNFSPPVVWAQNGAPLGYPSGPNARVWFGRIDVRASAQTRLGLEVQTRRNKGTPFGINGVPLAPDTNRVGVTASYALQKNAFVGLRVERGRGDVPSDLASQGAYQTYQTRVEANATFGF